RRRSFDDLRDEIETALDGRCVALIKLVPVFFRDDVVTQALRPVERMRHRLDAFGRHGGELPDHRDDVRQLLYEIRALVAADFETGEVAELVDVLAFERHWDASVTDVSLEYTRRLPIVPPVAKVAPLISAALALDVKELSRLFLERPLHRSRHREHADLR